MTVFQQVPLPLILKANAGLPDPVTNEYNISADEFAIGLILSPITLGSFNSTVHEAEHTTVLFLSLGSV